MGIMEPIGIQEIIEKYYPNYHLDVDIATFLDLGKILEKDYEDGDSADKMLADNYCGDANHPDIPEDYDSYYINILQRTLQAMYTKIEKCGCK